MNKKVGRPKMPRKYNKKELDWATLDGILQFGATKSQAADILETSEDTIDRRIKEKFNVSFEKYKERHLGKIKIKLQQKAIQMALSANTPMLIFCLKNLCGWRDKPEDLAEKDKSILIKYIIDAGNKVTETSI
jgi:hypothetical protein